MLTGGVFNVTSFNLLSAGTNASSTITLGGTAQVTLPAFPTTMGSGSSATLTFDFTTGWLASSAASTNYLQGLSAAYLTTNGANFNVGSGTNITVAQGLQNAASQAGVLRKSGAGVLTLSGFNTYGGATMISGGTLQIGFAGSANPVTIPNYGFETPTTSSYSYNPSPSGWTFSASSGVCKNTFFTTTPPQGSQAGFIQGGDGVTPQISQSITVGSDGLYQISFQAEGRGAGYGSGRCHRAGGWGGRGNLGGFRRQHKPVVELFGFGQSHSGQPHAGLCRQQYPGRG